MTRETMSACNVKDGIENPGCIGVSLLTAGQQLWRERVVHERTAAHRDAVSRASSSRKQMWSVPDEAYKSAAQTQAELRQELLRVSWSARQTSTVPNTIPLGMLGVMPTGRVRTVQPLTQPWSTAVVT